MFFSPPMVLWMVPRPGIQHDSRRSTDRGPGSPTCVVVARQDSPCILVIPVAGFLVSCLQFCFRDKPVCEPFRYSNVLLDLGPVDFKKMENASAEGHRT